MKESDYPGIGRVEHMFKKKKYPKLKFTNTRRLKTSKEERYPWEEGGGGRPDELQSIKLSLTTNTNLFVNRETFLHDISIVLHSR